MERLLRHASDHLSATYTTDDLAGVAVWHPPGCRGPSFIDSLRLLPSVSRLAGGMRRLREVSKAVAAATARNVLLYERQGFNVVEELTLPNTDVHGWLMLRPAAG